MPATQEVGLIIIFKKLFCGLHPGITCGSERGTTALRDGSAPGIVQTSGGEGAL